MTKLAKIYQIIFIFWILLFCSSYGFVNFSTRNLIMNNIDSWLLNETLNLQEGNILESVSKAKRFIQTSEYIKSLRVYSIVDDELSLIDTVGDKAIFPAKHYSVGIHQINFLKFIITKEINNGNRVTRFEFIGNPTVIATAYLAGFTSITLILIIFTFWISFITKQETNLRLSIIQNALSKLFQSSGETTIAASEIPELQPYWNELKNKFKDYVSAQSYLVNASQVAHDIRSPLSALEMMLSNINELPEEKRVIIRNAANRIRDIANSLTIDRNRLGLRQDEAIGSRTQDSIELEVILLPSAVEAIITEKRVQYRDNLKLNIEFNQTKESYGLFASINPNEFKRIISNIINNSVESFTHHGGMINVVLKDAEQDLIEISISDNGVGIPATVIGQLGKRGFTYGKNNGSGLGLHHAISRLEAWGGKLNITSKANAGTTVTILLPKKPSPAWFVHKLKLNRDTKIVIFDDDQTIHQIWNDRLQSYCSANNIPIVHLSTPIELRKYYGSNFSEIESNLFLVDYEILNSSETGLSLIEELGIQSQSILVTSRYEESSIRSRCEGQKIRLIPKTMSGFVPIEII